MTEPTFVLTASDLCAAAAIERYADLLEAERGDPRLVAGAQPRRAVPRLAGSETAGARGADAGRGACSRPQPSRAASSARRRATNRRRPRSAARADSHVHPQRRGLITVGSNLHRTLDDGGPRPSASSSSGPTKGNRAQGEEAEAARAQARRPDGPHPAERERRAGRVSDRGESASEASNLGAARS